jgi:hypothetical protein
MSNICAVCRTLIIEACSTLLTTMSGLLFQHVHQSVCPRHPYVPCFLPDSLLTCVESSQTAGGFVVMCGWGGAGKMPAPSPPSTTEQLACAVCVWGGRCDPAVGSS